MISYFTTNEHNLTAGFIVNDLYGNIVGCEPEVSVEAMANAVSALYFRISPKVFAAELGNGKIEVLSGNQFISGAHMFMRCNVTYPSSGAAEDLRGKMFSELKRTSQRRLREAEISMVKLSSFSGNQGKESAFRDMVKIVSELK